ncbi:MAG: amidase family protein [Jatrophihabitans sp.]|uniref:amidase family protein n=1 Tax=Jatrophihabitans sp. TaxID=1932789 RepID=UPI003F7FA238
MPLDPTAATATELLAALAAGELTSVDATRALLDRIAADDPRLGSVITVLPDALDQAAASDAHRREHEPRALEGVPVLVKDNIAVTGAATTAGSRALADSRPDDAPLVTRLRAAGAVILGKTNLSEWANFRSTRSTSGWSAVGGQTRNPHDPTRNTSGSSSGSGAAVAAGFAPLAVGTETDGSIISPAAICGIVGVKPTLGTVPGAGIVPISSAQDTAGPMARTVADAALLLAVLAGVEPSEVIPADLRGVRLGLWTPAGLDDATAAVLDATVEALVGAGAVVEPVTVAADALEPDEWPALLSEFKAEIDAYLASTPGAAVRSLADLVEFNRRDDVELSRFGQEILEQALAAPPLDDAGYREHRTRATTTARRMLDDALGGARLDAIVTVSNQPAWVIDYASGDHEGVATYGPAAVAGYPSVTVPAGVVDGLPVGVSLVGAAGADQAVLRLAAAVERVVDRPVRPVRPPA